jgi:thiamine-phosphate pyrophosphorylase
MADRCLLYYITDRSQFRGDEQARRRALLAKIAEAAAASVDYIQLREKDMSTRELEMLARDAMAAVRESTGLRTENRELRSRSRTRLLINSRTDVAIAIGADGVHLRTDDISPSDVREVWRSCGAGALARVAAPIITLSVHGPIPSILAASDLIDFAIFAPVFEKNGAAGTQPAGLGALREASGAKIPVLALGGVTIENAASCLNIGAAGVAGIRLFQENKIEEVVRTLRAL